LLALFRCQYIEYGRLLAGLEKSSVSFQVPASNCLGRFLLESYVKNPQKLEIIFRFCLMGPVSFLIRIREMTLSDSNGLGFNKKVNCQPSSNTPTIWNLLMVLTGSFC
jgi:hypothetical protein